MNNFSIKSIVHDYEVEFIDDTAGKLREVLSDGDWIIIDNKIKQLYGSVFNPVLDTCRHIDIDATETQKSYQGVEPIIAQLIKDGFRKNHRLIAIGGGITQDVTAFIASIMYRGVSWFLRKPSFIN